MGDTKIDIGGYILHDLHVFHVVNKKIYSMF